MSDPTPATRATTYERDEHRCASCGSLGPLQYQHRAGDGMGGRVERPRLEEGLTSCWQCNPRYEHDMQALALARGWKIPRWVRDQGKAADVPVFYLWEGRWCRLTAEGERVPISKRAAMGMMRGVYGPAWDDEKGLAA